MIRSLIKRVLGRVGKQRPDAARGVLVRKVWPAAELGLSRQSVSSAAIDTCEGLRKAGHQAFIVGGGVRDSLLGQKPKDFDVATDAPPEAVQRVFRRARIIGRRFQIVHVRFGREVIETSTFRALQTDAQTDAHGRVLRDNLFGTQEEDALRRDFTVNALYYDPVDEIVVDFLGGIEDLRARRLRMIGDPTTRYREDPVRMLRTVRFAAKLGLEVDSATLAPIRSLATLLENVPEARLFDEILKLLESGHALACVRRLRAEGLHHGVLPLLDTIVADEGGKRFVTLALEQTDRRVNAGKSVSPSFLFATLLWHQVQVRWQEGKARGELPIPALHQAIDTVLDRQGEKLAIQRRYQSDMREIWIMQPRLERRGRTSWRLMEHLRFRAGYDFLLLRSEAGELPLELGQWWTDFIDGDAQQRDRLLQVAADGGTGTARKRRKRRKSKPSEAADGDARPGIGAGPVRADDDGDRDDGDGRRDDPDEDATRHDVRDDDADYAEHDDREVRGDRDVRDDRKARDDRDVHEVRDDHADRGDRARHRVRHRERDGEGEAGAAGQRSGGRAAARVLPADPAPPGPQVRALAPASASSSASAPAPAFTPAPAPTGTPTLTPAPTPSSGRPRRPATATARAAVVSGSRGGDVSAGSSDRDEQTGALPSRSAAPGGEAAGDDTSAGDDTPAGHDGSAGDVAPPRRRRTRSRSRKADLPGSSPDDSDRSDRNDRDPE